MMTKKLLVVLSLLSFNVLCAEEKKPQLNPVVRKQFEDLLKSQIKGSYDDALLEELIKRQAQLKDPIDTQLMQEAIHAMNVVFQQQELIDALIDSHLKYVQPEDLTSLVEFYQTEQGQRIWEAMPRILEETQYIHYKLILPKMNTIIDALKKRHVPQDHKPVAEVSVVEDDDIITA